MAITIQRASLHHPQYSKFQKRWKMISDVVEGKEALDAGGETYLPKPSGRTTDEYSAYQLRAVLYNATARTLEGYLGAIYRKDPEIILPPSIQYLQEDADGEGNDLSQLSKISCRDVISLGRHGLLVDFPDASGIKTLADEKRANLQAHIKTYCPQSIVNWTTARRGAKTILTSVLIEESVLIDSDNFDYSEKPQIRYLRLDGEGLYEIFILDETEVEDPQTRQKRKVFMSTADSIKPRVRGERIDFIPFFFLGSTSSTPAPDLPPLYDIAQLNLAHYRNSADFEEAVFMVGQPTPWISGLGEKFIEENRNSLRIGSRAAWLLPEDSSVGMLESSADKNMILEAMRLKETEMVGIGARLIQDTSNRGSESTESVKLRRSGESSILACIADNVSKAYEKALNVAAWWMGDKNPNSRFRLNKDFFSARLTPNEIKELVAAWQSGAIPQDVLFDNFRKGEIVSELMDNEKLKDLLEDEEPPLGTMRQVERIDDQSDQSSDPESDRSGKV